MPISGMKSREAVKTIDIKIKWLGFRVKITHNWLEAYQFFLSGTGLGSYYVEFA